MGWFSSNKKFRWKVLLLSALVLGWAGALFAGIRVLETYGRKEGEQGRFALRWPRDSQITLANRGRASILMFLHPECPCSRATLEEMDRILAHAEPRPEVYAVFVVPPGWSDDRAKMALWLRANRMEGVTPLLDRGGQEARRFGAATSGQVYAYSPKGVLVYSGGITVSRGHEGDNPGSEAISRYLRTGEATVAPGKVFGCALFGPRETVSCGVLHGRAQGHERKKRVL